MVKMEISKKFTENTFVHVFLLLLVAVFTFLPTVENHFYLDDWATIYEISHGDRGLGWPPLFYTYYLNALLFLLFGVNPTGYFAVGIGIFALSVVTFYFFVSYLLKNKLLGFVAGLVYATVPTGIDTTAMVWTYVIEGGYPINLALIIFLYLLLRYFREKKIFFYLLALVGFIYLLEIQPRRVFLLLPIIFLFDYFMSFKRIIPNMSFYIRQLPFFIGLIANYKFKITITSIVLVGGAALGESSSYDWRTKLYLGVSSLIHVKPLVTFANVLFGAPLVFINEYANLINLKYSYFWVFMIVASAFALVVVGWKVRREWGLVLLFCLGWIYSNILGIYVFSSPGISPTTGRTISLSAPAYALFVSLSGFALYTFLKKREGIFVGELDKLFVVFLLITLGLGFTATRSHLENFNYLRSKHTHAFFKDLKSFYTKVPTDSLFYFQTPKDPKIMNRLSKIYGDPAYAGRASIAVFYGLGWEDVNVTKEYQDVKDFVKNDPSKTDNTFAFYFDDAGLSDITDNVRSELELAF